MTDLELDSDAVVAAVALGGRSGARNIEIGYVNDNPPHNWYVQAQYKGDRIIVEGYDYPDEAADGFAAAILEHGICTHCGGRTSITASDDVTTVETDAMDRAARRRLLRESKRKPPCLWYRSGREWKRGCEDE